MSSHSGPQDSLVLNSSSRRKYRSFWMASILLVTILASALSVDEASAYVSPAHSKQSTQLTNNEFFKAELIGSMPLILPGNVQVRTTLYNQNAYYSPSIPYAWTPMLANVVGYTQQSFAPSGLSWSASMGFSVSAVGSLNPYMVYWGAGGAAGSAYSLGCNMWISPPLHDCYRGAPDWLIVPGLSINLGYGIWAASPWFSVVANNHTISYDWWYQ